MEIPRFQAAGSGPARTDPVGLLAAWWRAVGAPVARLTWLRGVSRGKLMVVVPDLRWKREIGEHLDEILSRLRRAEGCREIVGIEMRVERSAGPPAKEIGGGGPPSPSGQAPPPEPSPDLPLAAGSLPDPLQDRRWNEAVARILARRRDMHEP